MTAQPVAPRSTTRTIAEPGPLGATNTRHVAAVESDLFDARAELVYQGSDLAEADSPENDALLERALRVEGLPPLARELIQAALLVEIAEGVAARRAEQRRLAASESQRLAIGGCERLLSVGATPEHEEFEAHGPTCSICAVGGQCRTGRELLRAADAADWQTTGRTL